MTGIEIRRASPDDAGAIGRIYDEAIAGGSATFATGPHHDEERRGWLAGRAATAPVFVAEDAGRLIGWSALCQARGWGR